MYRLGTFLSSLGSCGHLSAFVFVVVVVLFFQCLIKYSSLPLRVWSSASHIDIYSTEP